MIKTLNTLKAGLGLSLCAVILFSCTSTTEVYKPETHTVEIKQMKFEPAELTVHDGDTVVWVNHDLVAHDVTEETKKSWSSKSMAPGAAWKMAVTQNSDYYCSIHVVMKGKLRIEQ